jgi:membrane-bound inhibitor of C-type lysozyme
LNIEALPSSKWRCHDVARDPPARNDCMNGMVPARYKLRRVLLRAANASAMNPKRACIFSCVASVLAILTFAGSARATEARYACSGGGKLIARFSPPGAETGSVALTFEAGETISLPQVISADGGRYADKGVEFWIKGRNATLTRDGDSETCSTK